MVRKNIKEKEVMHEEEIVEQEYPSYEDILNVQKITMQDVMDHITGPVISIIAHVILISLLGTIVVFKPVKERRNIEVEMTEVKIKPLEKIPEPPKPPEEVEVEMNVDIERPDVQTQDTNVQVEDVAVEDAAVDVQMPNLLNVKPSNSALKLPGVFANRSGKGRRSALKKYYGSMRGEKKVVKALNWLAKHQNPDGSWGSKPNDNYAKACTALATLAFLAHGETPQSQTYGQTVLKALKKLIEYEKTMKEHSRAYVNGMVTYALAEGYALTKIPMLEKAMNHGVEIIIKGMNVNGSFNYCYNNGPQKPRKDPKTGELITPWGLGEPRSDLSVAGWNYQALKAAFAAGCKVKGLEETIDKAIEVGLKKTHFNKSYGGFAYNGCSKGGRGVSRTMTAVGTLCLQLFGAGKSYEAKKGLIWIEQKPSLMKCNWRDYAKIGWSLYGWYYQTQAIFQGHSGRGKAWRQWNREFTKALQREQAREGYWLSPAAKYYRPAGKNPKPVHGETIYVFKTDLNLKVFCTALCTLMLEVYYRYLPTFKVVHESSGGEDTFNIDDTKDDLGIKIE